MYCLCFIVVSMAAVAFGCSPPEGGYVPPTPPQKALNAQYIVIGEVTKILPEDPLHYGIGDSTYGAEVFVQCSYKGGPLPGAITIAAAGSIPGICTTKDVKDGTKYVLFLSQRTTKDNQTVYEQTAIAEPYYDISNYLDVCDLEMVYPQAPDGMTLKRKVCDRVKTGPCRVYDMMKNEVVTRQSAQGAAELDSPESTDTSTTQPENGTSGLRLSAGFVLTLFAFIFV